MCCIDIRKHEVEGNVRKIFWRPGEGTEDGIVTV